MNKKRENYKSQKLFNNNKMSKYNKFNKLNKR